MLTVDCHLREKQLVLGTNTIYKSPTKIDRISAQKCERFGEIIPKNQILESWIKEAENAEKNKDKKRLLIAQTRIGNIYAEGSYTDQNYTKAFEWYTKAAEKNYIDAQIKLNHLYEEGLGVEKKLYSSLLFSLKAQEDSSAVSRLKNATKEIKRVQKDKKQLPPVIRLVQPRLPEVGGSRVVDTSVDTEQQVIGAVMAPAGIKAFTVNERDERNRLDDVGLFSVPIPIKAIDVPVKLVATDRLNQSVSLHFRFKPKTKPPDTIGLDFGNYYALIIANKDYQEISDLVTPINDAEKVAEILESKYPTASECGWIDGSRS